MRNELLIEHREKGLFRHFYSAITVNARAIRITAIGRERIALKFFVTSLLSSIPNLIISIFCNRNISKKRI